MIFYPLYLGITKKEGTNSVFWNVLLNDTRLLADTSLHVQSRSSKKKKKKKGKSKSYKQMLDIILAEEWKN